MRPFASLALAALVGCGGSGPVQAPEPDQLGTFAYEASFEVQHQHARGATRNERLEIRGVIEVERDTVLIDARHGLCHPVLRPNVARYIFRCDEYTLSFDRRYPTMNPSFGAAVPVTRVEQGQCAEWRTNPNGSRTCLRYDYHEVPGTQQVGGVLRMRAIKSET